MKKMILSILLLVVTTVAIAQPPTEADKKEKVEAAKIAYITKELDLTPQEAQNFWPVYNQFQDELRPLNKKRATELLSAKINFAEMNDADVAKAIDNEFAYQQQELDLKKKYNTEFKKVLPMKKVAKYWVAEQKFKLWLIEQMKNGQQGKPGGGKPGFNR